MGRLSSYIFRQVAIGTVFVTVSLLAIVWLLQSLRFLTLIVSEGVSVLTFLHLTTLLMPNMIVTVLPIALFAVAVFTYNRMNNDRELVVIRAAGVGPLAIAKPVMILSGVATLILFWMTISVVPNAMHEFRQLQWSLRNDFSRILIQPGEFVQAVPGITVYIRARGGDGQLNDVVVHDARSLGHPGGAAVTFIAQRGALVDGPQGPQLVMINGSRSSTVHNSGSLSLLYFDNYTLDIPVDSQASNRARGVDELAWSDLLDATSPGSDGKPLVANALQRGNLAKAELHHRLSAPFIAPSLALVALSIILTGGFSRRGNSFRLLAAAIVLFAIEAAIVDSQSLAARIPALVILQYVIAIVPGIVAAFVLARPEINALLDSHKPKPSHAPPPASSAS